MGKSGPAEVLPKPPPKVPLPVGKSNNGFLAPAVHAPKQHLGRFSRFCSAHARADQQTYRQTTRHVYEWAASYAVHCNAT